MSNVKGLSPQKLLAELNWELGTSYASLEEAWLAYLQDVLSSSSTDLPELERLWLHTLGFTAGSTEDRWKAMLGSKGFNHSVPDGLIRAMLNRSLLQPQALNDPKFQLYTPELDLESTAPVPQAPTSFTHWSVVGTCPFKIGLTPLAKDGQATYLGKMTTGKAGIVNDAVLETGKTYRLKMDFFWNGTTTAPAYMGGLNGNDKVGGGYLYTWVSKGSIQSINLTYTPATDTDFGFFLDTGSNSLDFRILDLTMYEE